MVLEPPAHCAGGGVSNGAEPAVDILAARRATYSGFRVTLTSGFGAQRKWKDVLPRPNTTRLTQNGHRDVFQFALQQTVGRLLDHSSAIESTPDGTSMPITFVVLRLITSPNFVGT